MKQKLEKGSTALAGYSTSSPLSDLTARQKMSTFRDNCYTGDCCRKEAGDRGGERRFAPFPLSHVSLSSALSTKCIGLWRRGMKYWSSRTALIRYGSLETHPGYQRLFLRGFRLMASICGRCRVLATREIKSLVPRLLETNFKGDIVRDIFN